MSSYDPASYDPSSPQSSSYNPSTFTPPPRGGGNLSRNVPGRIALIAGVALTLLQLVRLTVMWTTMMAPFESTNAGLRNALNLAFGVGEVLLALVAVTFGAVGLGGRSRPRGSAAAGLALGVATLLLVSAQFLMPMLVLD